MPLSFDKANKLEGYVAVPEDRALNVCLAIRHMDTRPLSVDELDTYAGQRIEIQEAARAIELLHARAMRWALRDASADEADTPAARNPRTTKGCAR